MRLLTLKTTVFALLFTIFKSAPALSQSVGINTNSPDPSAVLDIKSTNKGILLPRMDSVKRKLLPAVKGLMVYDTTTNSFWYHTGTQLQNLSIGQGWSLSGNGNNNNATFLGTTDSNPLVIKVNSRQSGLVDTSGNTYLGYNTPGVNNTGITFNTGVGANTLSSNSTGSYNIAVGYSSLNSNTTGSYNTAIGYSVLFSNSTAHYNTGIGENALHLNTTGEGNTAIGSFALEANTTGSGNLAVGQNALSNNTTGISNVALGYWAMYSNTTASGNTGVGGYALFSNTSGGNNTALGYAALSVNNSGTSNTALGYNSLSNNSIGGYNTATGYWSMLSNKTGFENSAYGTESLYSDTSGFFNTAIGLCSLFSLTNGFSNTATGWHSMFSTTTGADNAVLGINALANNTTGSYNVAIGSNAMFSNVGGSHNIAIGYQADVGDNLTNATALGNGAVVGASNKVRIGNTGVTVIEGQVPFTNPSDGRFKFNIREDVKGLDFILKLHPVTYQFDVQKEQDFVTGKLSAAQLNSNIHQAAYDEASLMRRTGFIAQEVEQAATQSLFDFDGLKKPANEKDYYSLSYASFVVPLVKAVQEQQNIIDVLKKEIQEQKQLNNALLKRMEAIEKKFTKE